jgi:transcriptional regulator with AAA-type ATPase domain
VDCYRAFAEDLERFAGARGAPLGLAREPAHLFATFFQVRRAFHHIHATIVGASGPARKLRAAVWQSVFTHDARRYRRGLHARMGDIATLITGPSGTGKELVARAIGLSRYIPFDPTRQVFVEEVEGAFFALNLAALSPT